MLTAIVITTLMLPLYLLARAPYRRLPLHIDTGFYVSNNTVASRRWRFSRGWNAHYAGCSKVLPELIYSLVYLCGAPRDYKTASRLAASIYNFLTAIVVGLVASSLSGWDVAAYVAAFLVFAMLSSEPRYGVYFENAELFELPFQLASFAMLSHGLQTGSSFWIAAAAAIWGIESFFVKLSSAVAFVVLFGIIVLVEPWTWPAVLGGGALAGALYFLWMLSQGRRPADLLSGLAGHEANYGQRADWRTIRHRLGEKTRRLSHSVRAQPLIPVLAVVGAVIASPTEPTFWFYLLAVFATYVAQATDCWYYQVPLLPPIALLAAGGLVSLTGTDVFWFLCGLGAAIWLVNNTWHALRADPEDLNRRTWEFGPARGVAGRNAGLEALVAETSDLVSGRSLLVYGPLNQAYVLYGAAFDTPIVAPEHYLDDVCPGWQTDLNRRLAGAPPEFILDTGDCFDPVAARNGLGLDYRLQTVATDRLRLFSLHARNSAPGSAGGFSAAHIDDIRTFALQSPLQLNRELKRAGMTAAPSQNDRTTEALADLLRSLADRGLRRVALYGAGRFTLRHAETYRRSPVNVAVVLDDLPERHNGRFIDWPVTSPDRADRDAFDCVVVSTDRFAGPMADRIRRLYGRCTPVFNADASHLPHPVAPPRIAQPAM